MIETLSGLVALMKSYGAVRFYAKKLAPNDNSKNQVYLGGIFLFSISFPIRVSTRTIPALPEVCETVPRQMYHFHGLTRMAGMMLPVPSSFFIPNIPKSGCLVF